MITGTTITGTTITGTAITAPVVSGTWACGWAEDPDRFTASAGDGS